MARLRRRQMHYTALALHDGTVTAAFPVRKPIERVLKREGRRADLDGVVSEHRGAGREIANVAHEGRIRFQDIIATNLNSRRALRDLVLPVLADALREVRSLRERLDRIEQLLERTARSSSNTPPSHASQR